MSVKPPLIDYEAPPRSPPRIWHTSAPVWFALAAFCAFVEIAGSIATNGRIGGWADIAFITILAAIGLVALINALRLSREAHKTVEKSHPAASTLIAVKRGKFDRLE